MERHRSPFRWAVIAVAGAFAVEVVATAAWNAWVYRDDLRKWLKL